MEKRYYLILIVIIILIIFGYFFINNGNINLQGTSFKSIEGYDPIQGENFINFTSGGKFIYVGTFNGTLNHAINNYVNSKNKTEYELSDFSLEGLKVYRVTLNNYTIAHYWFEKNHQGYEIFTWSYDEKTNLDILNLIKSANP